MKKATVSNSFFIEIIIAILFFSLCVAITLQLFVSAHLKSELSEETNIAIIKLQNEAEELKAKTNLSDINNFYQQYSVQSKNEGKTTYRIPMNKDWVITNENPKYYIEITLENQMKQNGTMLKANMAVFKTESQENKELCDIDVSHYVAKT